MRDKKHIFLYGERQIGKSTIVKEVMSKLNVEVAGFYTKFSEDSQGNKTLWIHSANEKDKLCGEVAKWCDTMWQVDTKVFDEIGVKTLVNPPFPQMYVMDECGRLEKNAKEFQRCILNILDGTVPVLGVLHYKNFAWKDVLLSREDVLFLEVTESNREKLADSVVCFLKERI